ncbi:putative porin [Nitrospinaceae bacterium]|nr:putative porin [Nitrospinaceae bacterium]
MDQVWIAKKIITGFILGVFILALAGTASAMTKEDLARKALIERVNSHDKLLESLERISWFGGMRLRYERVDRASDNSTANDADGHLDTDRPRIRFRFGARAHVYEDLDFVFRLSTGGDDASTSGNTTLDGTFGNEAISLNLAYGSWEFMDGLTVQGGKVKNPFMRSEVVWDGDVNPEGLSEIYQKKSGDTTLQFVAGQYIVEETDRNTTVDSDDVVLLAWQAQLHQKTKAGKFKFAIAWYDYNHLTDSGSAVTKQLGSGDGQRNSQVTGTNVNTTNIQIFDFMADWSSPLGSKHGSLFYEYAVNTDADAPAGNNTIAQDLDTAWQLGFKFGDKKVKKTGQWQIKTLYRLVQQDAVFYALTDSDFHQGGTNAKGIELRAKYAIRKGMQLGYTFFNTENERGDINGGKLDVPGQHQLDLKFTF